MEYKGWLTSQNIIKRSLAVYGHFILGYLIVMILLGIVFAFILLLSLLW